MSRVAALLLLLAVSCGPGCASPGRGSLPGDLGAKGADLRGGDGGGPRDLLVLPADLATPADLLPAADLSRPPDLSTPSDLSRPLDLSTPPDLAMPPPPCDKNACQAACLAQCILMMKVGIGACQNGVCACICV